MSRVAGSHTSYMIVADSTGSAVRRSTEQAFGLIKVVKP
jgi:hypothetical protein